jgi:pimeloyl-ACP methyl ester carboxylesterase
MPQIELSAGSIEYEDTGGGGPALVVWAAEDRLMPPEHGRRLAELLPDARLVEIDDSYTLIPEDQPGELARSIREFVRDAAPEPATRRSHVRTHAAS